MDGYYFGLYLQTAPQNYPLLALTAIALAWNLWRRK